MSTSKKSSSRKASTTSHVESSTGQSPSPSPDGNTPKLVLESVAYNAVSLRPKVSEEQAAHDSVSLANEALKLLPELISLGRGRGLGVQDAEDNAMEVIEDIVYRHASDLGGKPIKNVPEALLIGATHKRASRTAGNLASSRILSIDGDVSDLRDRAPAAHAIEDENADRRRDAFDKILNALPDTTRRIIELRIDEVPYKKIAKIVGWTEGALRVQVHHTRKKIQEELDSRGFPMPPRTTKKRKPGKKKSGRRSASGGQ